jgi:hypothetical protein
MIPKLEDFVSRERESGVYLSISVSAAGITTIADAEAGPSGNGMAAYMIR